jgi:hypothetical protein
VEGQGGGVGAGVALLRIATFQYLVYFSTYTSISKHVSGALGMKHFVPQFGSTLTSTCLG